MLNLPYSVFYTSHVIPFHAYWKKCSKQHNIQVLDLCVDDVHCRGAARKGDSDKLLNPCNHLLPVYPACTHSKE